MTASGKRFSPSTTAIRMSLSPRVLSLFITRSQNFAPSVCSTNGPTTSFWSEQRIPVARYTALLRTSPSSRIFTRSAFRSNDAPGLVSVLLPLFAHWRQKMI